MERAGDGQDLGAWSSRDAVEAWQRSSTARNATLAAATERMLDLAALRPGARVLDLGTGAGDQAFAAAARVGPQGHVLATDISAEMVAETAAGAARAGLNNVATRVLDVAAIDLEPDRWDAVISRLGLMFTPDLAAALTGARRVLRAGGRLAVIVWSTPERNPFHATPLERAARAGAPGTARRRARARPLALRARRAGASPRGRWVSRRRRRTRARTAAACVGGRGDRRAA